MERCRCDSCIRDVRLSFGECGPILLRRWQRRIPESFRESDINLLRSVDVLHKKLDVQTLSRLPYPNESIPSAIRFGSSGSKTS
jgi:hypothetical protein